MASKVLARVLSNVGVEEPHPLGKGPSLGWQWKAIIPLVGAENRAEIERPQSIRNGAAAVARESDQSNQAAGHQPRRAALQDEEVWAGARRRRTAGLADALVKTSSGTCENVRSVPPLPAHAMTVGVWGTGRRIGSDSAPGRQQALHHPFVPSACSARNDRGGRGGF